MQLTRRDSGLTLYHVDPYDIISMLLETLSYGMFLVLFLVSFVLLLQRRRTFLHDNTTTDRAKRSVSFYLITGVLMFLVITAVCFVSKKRFSCSVYNIEVDILVGWSLAYPRHDRSSRTTTQAQSYYLSIQRSLYPNHRSARWCHNRVLDSLPVSFDHLPITTMVRSIDCGF